MSKDATEKLFSGTVFFSSALFFALFLFYAEKILPLFSQTGNVFAVTALFVALCALTGSVFIHFLNKASEQRQAVFVGGFIFLSVFFLPMRLYGEFGGTFPPGVILKNLFYSAFIPFFILSWPFFLFGNVFENAKKTAFLAACGALTGITAYVWGIREWADFGQQALWLTVLYVLFLIDLMLCLYFLHKKDDGAKNEKNDEKEPFSLKIFGRLFLYGFVCVSLCLSVIQYVFVNLYPSASLYVVPVLFTVVAFAFAFSKLSDLFFKTALFLQPFALALFFLIYLFSFVDVWLYLNVAVLTVFVSVCACLIERESLKKDPFCAMAVISGALGAAAFNGVFVSYVSGWSFEYPLIIVLALALRPGVFFANRSVYQVWQDFAYPLALFFVCFCGYFLTANLSMPYQLMLEAGVFVIVGALCLLREYPLRYAMTAAVAMVFGAYVFAAQNKMSVFNKKPVQLRNFYGSVAVAPEKTADGSILKLYLNGFLKGVQYRTPEKNNVPQRPYDKNSGVGKFFMSVADLYKNPSVGVVGMGAGALATYATNPYQDWRFFEPDADIADLASGYNALFTHYRQNTPYAPVTVGEPVTGILREHKKYDVLIIDTFAFKTFPLYLMSPDAFAVYLRHLTKKGVLLFHTVMPYAVWGETLSGVLKQLPVYVAIFRNPDFPESQWIAVTFDENVVRALRQRDNLWENMYLR